VIDIHLDLTTVLIWVIVGGVAGFIASHLMLGHGLGLVGDVVAGILGAVIAYFAASYFGVTVTVPGHPLITQILIATFGALVVLLVLRVAGLGRGRRRRVI
jgi:uncharacterized membrane protein YeaQ/YmgE (transglycosylase-associated protein family)